MYWWLEKNNNTNHSVSKYLLNNTQISVQELDWTKQIIDTTVMRICITNTVVEVNPSLKTFKEKLYREGRVFKLGAPLLIRLLNVSLQTWLIQYNHRTPSAQLIRITIISMKVWYKQKNNNTDYKDVEAKQVSSDSYLATT